MRSLRLTIYPETAALKLGQKRSTFWPKSCVVIEDAVRVVTELELSSGKDFGIKRQIKDLLFIETPTPNVGLQPTTLKLRV